MSATRRYYLLLGLLCLGIGWWYIQTRRFGHTWGDDYAQYLYHARNILEGRPYKDTGHLLNPYYQISPETYPPVFPLLLAPVVKAVGVWDFASLKLVGITCFVLSLLVWGRWLAREAQAEHLAPDGWPAQLLPLVGLIAVTPTAWDLKDQILSDLPYLLMQALALVAVQRFRDQENLAGRRAMWEALVLGGALWLPYGCRSIGFTMAAAFLAEQLWRFRWRPTAARWVGVALLMLGLLVLAQRLYLDSHDDGYTAQLRKYFTFQQIIINLQLYWGLFCRFWGEVPGLGAQVYSILGAGIFGLVAHGWYLRWRQAPMRTAELYFIVYAGVVILWPMPQGERFLMPLIPLGLYYTWRGTASLFRVWGQQLPSMLAMALLLSGVAAIGRTGPIEWQIDTPEQRKMLDWISWQPLGSTFLVGKPRAVALYTRQRAMQLRSLQDSAMVEQDIAAADARYLVTFKDTANYLPQDARAATEVGNNYILELTPTAERHR